MSNTFAAGKKAIAVCDRCGFQFRLNTLRKETVKGKTQPLLVCNSCWSPDHPQLMLGMYPVVDPQALRNPRRDTSYAVSGSSGEGSRVIEWGWAPVGGADSFLNPMVPNALRMTGEVGSVTVTT